MQKDKSWEIIASESDGVLMTFRPRLPFVADDIRFIIGEGKATVEISGSSARLALPVDPEMIPELREASQVRLMEFDHDRADCVRDILVELS